MSRNWNDIALALAGTFQAAALVEQLAKTGYLPSSELEASIGSLFVQNPDDVISVYGGNYQGVELGLSVMSELLSRQKSASYPDTLRYVLGILHLQKKMMGRQDMLQVIGKRLEQGALQAERFGITHENVIANLADIYSDTISTFKFRIQVIGDYNYLQQPRIANQVRALLFSGIRAATLWRQVGGRRPQILLQRKQIIGSAEQILKTQTIE